MPSDRLLSIALTLHEQSRGACGHYMDEAFGGRGSWEVHEVVCAACAVIEKHHDGHEKPTPGAKVFAVDTNSVEFSEDEVQPNYG